MREPLAIKMRPTKLDDIIGQKHLVSKGKPIYNFVKNRNLAFWKNKYRQSKDTWRIVQ